MQSWKQDYAYDRYGNRSFVGGAGKTTIPLQLNPQTNPGIDPTTNHFTGGAGYGYDAAGNLTSATGSGYVFDGENRMVQAWDGQPNPNRYFYDGDGRRVKKVTTNGQETTIFVYNAQGQLVAEYNNSLPVSENQTSYLTSDVLGTPRVLTKADGSVQSRHDYLPFGEDVGASVGGRTTGQGYSQPDGVRQRFTSKERDDETELDYFGARYYASSQGRFTAVDPVLSKTPMQTWRDSRPLVEEKMLERQPQPVVVHYADQPAVA